MTDLLYDRIRRSPNEPALSLKDWRGSTNQWVSDAKSRKVEHTKDVCDRITISHSEPVTTISFVEDVEFTLPHHFSELADQIRKADYILKLKDNWDDEGSIAYSKKTFSAAINFAIEYSKAIWEEESVLIDAPKISPGPKGSIDLLWDEKTYRLLINIHPDPKQTASFYGDNRTQVPHIKGDFFLSDEPDRAIILLLLKAKR